MGVFESLLNGSFAVSRRTGSSDGQGGWSIGYVALGSVRGRLRPASSEERLSALQEQRRITHVFYCLATEDVARGDRLEGLGIVVDVEGVREPSRAAKHLECDCLEVQRELRVDGS